MTERAQFVTAGSSAWSRAITRAAPAAAGERQELTRMFHAASLHDGEPENGFVPSGFSLAGVMSRRERRDVAAQEEADARAVARLPERVGAEVEVAGRVLGVLEAVLAAVPVGEAPHAVPVLERRDRAREDAAHAAEHAGAGEVPLRDGERLVRHAREAEAARGQDGREDRVAVAAAARQAPALLEELGTLSGSASG